LREAPGEADVGSADFESPHLFATALVYYRVAIGTGSHGVLTTGQLDREMPLTS
jgi:hypothetical protein